MTALAEQTPTKEECLLACVAHLALFGGFWLIGPLAIYFWKGKASRFLAFHSVQAILLSLLMIAFGAFGAIFMIVFALGFAALGAALHPAVAGVGMLAGYLLGGLLIFLPTVFAIVGGVRAFKAEWWSMPIIGGLARRWLERPEIPTTAV